MATVIRPVLKLFMNGVSVSWAMTRTAYEVLILLTSRDGASSISSSLGVLISSVVAMAKIRGCGRLRSSLSSADIFNGKSLVWDIVDVARLVKVEERSGCQEQMKIDKPNL